MHGYSESKNSDSSDNEFSDDDDVPLLVNSNAEADRQTMSMVRVTCDGVNFCDRHWVGLAPFVDIRKRITFVPGEIVEFSLDGVRFDWTEQNLDLYIPSRRLFTENRETVVFTLDLVIPFSQRRGRFRRIFRAMSQNQNHLSEDIRSILNTYRSPFEYRLIENTQTEAKQREIEEVERAMWSMDKTEFLDYLDTKEGYRISDYH